MRAMSSSSKRASLLAAASCVLLVASANPLTFHGNDASCGNPTGWLTVDVNFGTPPYTYLWSNSSTNDTITATTSVTTTAAIDRSIARLFVAAFMVVSLVLQ